MLRGSRSGEVYMRTVLPSRTSMRRTSGKGGSMPLPQGCTSTTTCLGSEGSVAMTWAEAFSALATLRWVPACCVATR